MSTPQILEETTITTADLKSGLDAIQKRDEELSFRAGKTIDHLNHIPTADVKSTQALAAAMQTLDVPRLKAQHIHKIIDIMPQSVKELNVILSGYTLTVNKEYQQKIMDVLNG